MPTIAEVRQDQAQTRISVEYANDQSEYIADGVLPTVPVVLESDIYYVYDKSRFGIPEAKRNARAVYKEIDWSATKDSYFAEEYGLEGRIDDRERRNSVAEFDLDSQMTETLTDAILLNRERRVANLVTNPSNVTQNATLSGTARWDDAVNSDPRANTATARIAVRTVGGNIGINTLAIGWRVWESLQVNQQFLDYLDGNIPTLDAAANFFQVDEVLVGGALYNTARQGQTVSLGDIWGKMALFFHRERRPALRRPSFGYQMVVQDLQVFRYRDVPVNCDVIRVNEIRAEKLVAPQLGYLYLSVVS